MNYLSTNVSSQIPSPAVVIKRNYQVIQPLTLIAIAVKHSLNFFIGNLGGEPIIEHASLGRNCF